VLEKKLNGLIEEAGIKDWAVVPERMEKKNG
jgi:hypothetical protein